MSNQFILWGSIILPWLTVFFLKKEDVKRYLPVALFGALITTVITEIALALNWWINKDVIFPFYHLTPFSFGGFLVGIIWIFKYTYRRFFLYMLVNAAFNFILTGPFVDWLESRGIIEFVNIAGYQLLLINLANAAVLYGYQLWQEEVLVPAARVAVSPRLQPSAAKPLPPDRDEAPPPDDRQP
jgi:hypothetical protein